MLAQTGTGKSALAAQLLQSIPDVVAIHFCIRGRRSTIAPRTFIRSLAAQLSIQIGDYAEALANTIKPHLWVNSNVTVVGNVGDRAVVAGVIIEQLVAAGPLDEFETLLQTPLNSIRDPGSARVIVIDGLDEAATIGEPNIPSLLELIEELPPWLRFICTSQPDRRVLRHVDEGRTQVRHLSKTENHEALRQYTERRGYTNPAFVSEVAEKADGNFQYARVLLDAIDAGSVSADEVPDLPPGLPEIYGRLLRRISIDNWSGALFRIASALAVAFEPLSEEQLSRFSRARIDEIRMHLAVFGQFLESYITADNEITYTIFHQSLRDYFFDRATNRDLWISAVDGHARIAGSYAAFLHEAWKSCDRYGLRYLPAHLKNARREDDLSRLLLDFNFLQHKLDATDPSSLLADFDLHPGNADLRLIREAVQLSAHITARDPAQFASQLVGRLLPYLESLTIRKFMEAVTLAARRPWLRPLRPALQPPGSGLLRTFSNHTGRVIAVAITPDGRRVVSASADRTLKVWELETGRELHTLAGHDSTVTLVVMTPDGRRAVSVCNDTIKLWDLDTGRELRTLVGHTKWVTAVAVTPDGLRAVSASADRTLKIWELETGSELHTLVGHFDIVADVAVTSDGQRAVSASRDGTLKVWELETGDELQTLAGHTETVRAVAATPDGRHAVSASIDDTLKVWELETGSELHTLTGHTGKVRFVAVTPDGRRAVSASINDYELKVWDLETGRELHTLAGHDSMITAVVVTRDGLRAVSASADWTLKVWELETGGELDNFVGHTERVEDVAVTPDGRRAVSASTDDTLKKWELQTGYKLRPLASRIDTVTAAAVTPDGQRAVFASSDDTLKVWDLETGRELHFFASHTPGIIAVAVTPDGRRAVSVSADRPLRVWDLEAARALHTLVGHTDRVTAVTVTLDGRRAVSASADHVLKVWDMATGRELHTLTVRGYNIHAPLIVTPDGRRAVCAFTWNNELNLLDLETGRKLRTLAGQTGTIRVKAMSQDGRLAMSASTVYDDTDNSLKVWELETGRELYTLVGHTYTVNAVAMTSDGRLAVSASQDDTLKVWDLATGRELHTLAGHTSGVTAVAVTPDGRLAVSASQDHTLNVWELETGRKLHTLSGHTGGVEDVAVTLDGRRAVSTSGDRTLKVWELETGAPIAAFSCDSAMQRYGVSNGRTIVVGDKGNRLHVLALET